METLPQDFALVRVDEIRPHPQNPRQGDVGAIHESIKENGFYGALVVQKSTGHILAGNHRWQAARQGGLDELPALVVDVDDDAALRILLVDNRTNDLASYDEAALAGLLLSMDELLGTGYSLDDLQALQKKLDDPLKLDDSDSASKLGDGKVAIIVSCRDEAHQRELLTDFESKGLQCRALMM